MNFSDRLLQWFAANGRELPWRHCGNPYIIWVSEIILQQTRVNQGISYIQKFVEAFPDVAALAEAPVEKVLRVWQGLGYYARARNLHAAANQIVKQHNGQLPQTYEQWLEVKGVGQYTAAAIASIACNQPVAAIDGNGFRVLARIFAVNENIDTSRGKKIFYQIASELIDKRNPGDFNQAMMDFGATVCKPTAPDCLNCIFNRDCLAFLSKTTDKFPIRNKRVKPRQRHFNYFLFFWKENNGDMFFLVNQRKGNDIWKNLYELPLIETEKPATVGDIFNSTAWQSWFAEKPQSTFDMWPHTITHQLTHQTIQAKLYLLRINPDSSKSLLSQFQKVGLDVFEQLPKSRLMIMFFEQSSGFSIFLK